MKLFNKGNSSSWSDALLVEAKGLELLRDYCEELDICIPQIQTVDEASMSMENVESVSCSPEQSHLLGQELARMHNKSGDSFGLEYDNMIGLNRQINGTSENWGEFFVEKRLEYQVSLVSEGSLKTEFGVTLQNLKQSLTNLLNETTSHPSLLHGDLWSGNYLCSKEQIWLIDPAVYFGDREADLAMTHMFGGFSPEFYQGYESVHPLGANYPIKEKIYNLYHYLNHLNLFGGSYLNACRNHFSEIDRHLES